MQPIQINFPNGESQNFLSPTGYADLSEKNFILAIHLMKRSETEPSAQWLLPVLLMKMPITVLKQMNEVQRVELLGTFGFLFDLDALPSKCMIKKVSVRAKDKSLLSLYGPGDTMKHLTFAEFMMAESKLERYQKTKNEQDLNQFCGVLYRPSSKSRLDYADKRVPYKEGLVEHHGAYFSSVDPDMKLAILMNYRGMKNMLPKLYANVFPAPLQDTVKEQGKSKKPAKSAALSWLELLSSMADMDVTKYPAIEGSPVHTVLFNLNQTIDRNEKAKNEMAQLKQAR